MENNSNYISMLKNLNTNYLGKTFLYLPTIDSTNTKAKNLAAENKSAYPNGFLIVSEEQTKGKGRLGRVWHSPSGCGLWFSLILRPTLSLSDISKITLISAVALCDALKKSGVNPQIKWPNDIFVNNKKVAGILTEMNSTNGIINFVILGIGVNINTKSSDFPVELKEIATSLSIEYDKYFNRTTLLSDFLHIFEKLWDNFLKTGSLCEVMMKYKENNIIIGRNVRIINLGKEELVFVKDITESGELLAITESGDHKLIVSGDVSLRF